MERIDLEAQALAVAALPKPDRIRIDTHPLRGGRRRQDFVSELLLRGLNQPELVRLEEALRGGLPDGYYDAEVQTVNRVDSRHEDFEVVIRIIPFDGRRIVVHLWYPPADTSRRGRHEHFNLAVGLPPHARLFGRELEVEGARIRMKYWHEHTSEGVEEQVHFFKAVAANAA